MTGYLYLLYPIKVEDFIERIDVYSDSSQSSQLVKSYKEKSDIRNYVNRFRGTKEFEVFCGQDSVIDPGSVSFDSATEAELKTHKDFLIRENGYHYSTFRRNLTDNWLSIKTNYYHQKETYHIPDVTSLELECDYYVRLSYSGIVELRKEIKLDNLNVFTLLKFLLGLKKEMTDDGQASTESALNSSWEYVKEIFAKYVNSELHGTGSEHNGKYYKITSQSSAAHPESNAAVFNSVLKNGSQFILKSQDTIKTQTLKRNRYAVILANKIARNNIRLKNLKVEKVLPLISGILEGSLTRDERSKKYVFPEMSPSHADKLQNLSTWNEEFCFMGTERTFIYYKNIPLTYTDDDKNERKYKDYWESIVRGIEHTVSITALLTILHKQTTEYLCDVPNLMRRFAETNKKSFDINFEKDETKAAKIRGDLEIAVNKLHNDLFDFGRKVSNISNIVPKVRDICIPNSAFRAGMVVEKFEYLNNQCFNTPTILKNITDNLNELSSYLLFFQQQQLLIRIDEASDKVEEKNLNLSMIASLLTFASIIYVSVSFWNDFYQFMKELCFAGDCGPPDLRAFIVVLSYLGILMLIYILFRKILKEFVDSTLKSMKENWLPLFGTVLIYFIVILLIAIYLKY